MALTERFSLLIDAAGGPAINELRRVGNAARTEMGSARKEIDATANHGGKFQAMANLGRTAFLGIGAAAVTFGGLAVKAGIEGEQAHARFANAVKNTGGNLKALSGPMDELVKKFEKFGYENDAVETAVARLTTSTGSASKAMQNMGLVADFAAARHIDLEAAATLVGKVMNGNVGALRRLGIATKDAAGNTLTAAQAMDMLKERFGGAAAAQADTFAGKMQAFKATLANLTEEVGNHLLPILIHMGEIVVGVIRFFERHTAIAKTLGVVIGGPLVAAMSAYVAVQARAVAVNIAAFWTKAADAVAGLAGKLVLTNTAMAGIGAEAGTAGAAGALTVGASAATLFTTALVGLGAATVAGVIDTNRHKEGIKGWAQQFVESSATFEGATDRVKAKQAELRKQMDDARNRDSGDFLEAKRRYDALGDALTNYTKTHQTAQDVRIRGTHTEAEAWTPVYNGINYAKSAYDNLKGAFDRAAEGAQKLKDGLDALIGVHVSATEAEIRVNEAVQKVTDSFKENGRNIDINTEKGRANMSAILDSITAFTSQSDALGREGKTAGETNAILGSHIDQLKGVLRAAGLTTQQVDALVKQYHLIPDEISTTIDLEITKQGRAAMTELSAFLAGTSGDVRARAQAAFPHFRQIGGFVTRPEMTVLGEAGTELVLPLTNMARTMELLRQAGLVTQLYESGGMSGAAVAAAAAPVGGNLTVGQIVIPGAHDPQATARAVRDKLVRLKKNGPLAL